MPPAPRMARFCVLLGQCVERLCAGGMRLGGHLLRPILLASTALCALALPAAAQDATWLASPGTNDFNTAANWSTGSVPTGTAFFGTSNTTTITSQTLGPTNIGGWTFNAGASNYNFTTDNIEFLGAGIAINGGSATINNNNQLTFKNTSTAGNAAITNPQNSVLGFVDTSSAGSANITSSGSIFFDNGSTAGSATISASNSNGGLGSVAFSNSSTAANANITVNSGGGLTFLDTSTAGNANITNNGATVTFVNSSTAGSATIIINSGGTLGFQGNATAGNAAITNNAGGNVSFFLTSGPGGLNKVSAGSIAGAGNYDIGANELTVGGNNLSTTVAGRISDLFGGGSLVKIGTGTLTLSSIGNNWTGPTSVNGGTLVVNGRNQSSAITVNNGSTLGGTGRVADTTIASGGTLAPGNSVGTLTVNGNLIFNAGSSYIVEVSPTAADRTNVTGTATLTGATIRTIALPGSFHGQTYTILNATGGLGGTQFASFISSNFAPGARNPHLTYDANNVFLVLDPGTIELPPGVGGNQAGVAGGINNAVLNGGIPPAGFDALLTMSGAQLTNALAQVSGEGGNGATTQTGFASSGQFVGTMLDPSIDGRGGGTGGGATGYAEEEESEALAYSSKSSGRDAFARIPLKAPPGPRDLIDPRWSVWASGYGGSASVSGNAAAGTNSTSASIYGTAVGADYRINRDTLVGFAMGGGGTNFSTAQNLGKGRADLFQAGVYGRKSFGAAYIAGALAYGWQDVTIDRTVTVAGTDQLRAKFDAQTFAARIEAGYRFATALMGVTPYGALQATRVHLPGYSEFAVSGSNQFALAFVSQTTNNLRSELGLRGDKSFAMQDGTLILRSRVAWAHDSNTSRAVNPAFQSLPGSAFTVNGAKPAADGALVSAGPEMKWRNGWSAAGLFEGEFSRTTESYAGKVTVKYAW